jgi:RNA-directed DNA polymerase
MVETEAGSVAAPVIEDWTQTPWRKLEQHVYRLQKRIYKAQERGKREAVHSLQRLVMKSRAARTLAVRRVTQDNQGKKTAGVDGVKSVGPLGRLLLVDRLRHPRTIQAHPVRRVRIPKPGKPGESRPLGIPVMLDRAHQALAKLALEPQWEARFEPNSYGFRPGRSCHDAIETIFCDIKQQDKYVLDADIKGCFDAIAHTPLLAKLDTIPSIRRAVKAWLRAGVLDGVDFTPTTSGAPQGGVLSPLLANVALHGMEEIAAQAYRRRTDQDSRIRPKLIRYADDFVILCRDREGVVAAREAVEHWLSGLGLHLSPSKTRITHTLRPHEGNVGFDFLGFTVRQYATGKTHSGKIGRHVLGFRTHITPSTESITRHMTSIGNVVRANRSAPQQALIGLLNPIIRGWANYYRTAVAAGAFGHCDHQMFAQLQSWARFRHPKKSQTWINYRYWNMQPGAKWVFAAKEHGKITHRLASHKGTHIRRHLKVKERASPYDGNLLYWANRLKDHPLTRNDVGRLLLRQQGRCPHCGLTFRDEDVLEVDHRIPIDQGGDDVLSNKQVLHRHCHDQKTAEDYRRRCS